MAPLDQHIVPPEEHAPVYRLRDNFYPVIEALIDDPQTRSVDGGVDHTVLVDQRLAAKLRGFDDGLEVVVAGKRAHLDLGTRDGRLDPLPDFVDTDHRASKCLMNSE